jgi:lysophospholipid acyltransferase (LPLAT)-like uncharacterized protein
MKEKLLGLIASFFIKVYCGTFRYRLHFRNQQEATNIISRLIENNYKDKNLLLGFFHQDELSLIPLLQNLNIAVLISQSKDGSIMANLATELGYLPVRGSSSRGAVSGLLAAFKKVKSGYHFAMALDGPKGPIYKVKEGLPNISQKVNLPILPMRAYPKKYFYFKNAWNKAKLPYPFSRVDVYFGELSVSNAQELEEKLINILNNDFQITIRRAWHG